MMWRRYQNFVESVRRGSEARRAQEALIKTCTWKVARRSATYTVYAGSCCDRTHLKTYDGMCPACGKTVVFEEAKR